MTDVAQVKRYYEMKCGLNYYKYDYIVLSCTIQKVKHSYCFSSDELLSTNLVVSSIPKRTQIHLYLIYQASTTLKHKLLYPT